MVVLSVLIVSAPPPGAVSIRVVSGGIVVADESIIVLSLFPEVSLDELHPTAVLPMMSRANANFNRLFFMAL